MKRWAVVRVTDMRGVDLRVFSFNYDLTMAVLLMHPDGTIYATYAGRDFTDASSHQSTGSLARVLDAAWERHEKHEPKDPLGGEPVVVERLPWWRGRKRAQKRECFHCHQVHDAWQNAGRKAGTWTERDQYTWPDPAQIGLRLDREDQVRVTEARAPLRKGDRIVAIGGREPLAFGDVQRALHEAPWEAHELRMDVLRGGERKSLQLSLPAGWKKPEPRIYAWRCMKWPMPPMPGFGGPPLTAAEKAELGLPKDAFAFRVGYVVTWGPNARTGKNAHEAGIRRGMVVYEVDGKSDFESGHHFHAWFRMTRTPGKPVRIKVFRNGTRESLSLTPLP